MDELKAAGISDPALRDSYIECKRLNALHGKTYYLATLLLPKAKRPFVHALYGFARYADEIVDDLNSELSVEEKAQFLQSWSESVVRDLERGESKDAIGKALADTVNRFAIPLHYFSAFLRSMEMDLSVTRYQNFDELMDYMYGSAAVIGLQMVPILGAQDERAFEGARKLGVAFQLANFIRDVGEDLERGRIYLPLDELESHGVDEEMLRRRILTPQITSLLKFQIARVRALQAEAESTIIFLDKESQPCIRAASKLYCGIVDEIERIDYEIFKVRANTSIYRRIRVAGMALIRTLPYRFSW